MITIELPISKSIAQRVLILNAIKGNIADIPFDSCHDVQLMHHILQHYLTHRPTAPASASATPSPTLHYDLHDNGTAMRLLTAFFAQEEGAQVRLTGTPRLTQRPLSQLVDALRSVGADITYEQPGSSLPLLIRGQRLKHHTITLNDPLSTQFITALLLIRQEVNTNIVSPYIDLTRQVMLSTPDTCLDIERDWSAAAFFYERVALFHETYRLPQLNINTTQADVALTHIFRHFGVKTTVTNDAVILSPAEPEPCPDTIDCQPFPDIVPAIMTTAHLLHLPLHLTGIDSLRLKESDRIAALQDNFNIISHLSSYTTRTPLLHSHNDHRIAMAMLAAGFLVDNTDCLSKSFPTLLQQLRCLTFIIPTRQHTYDSKLADALPDHVWLVSDEGKGKKQALLKGILNAPTEYVWLTDDDVARTAYPCFLNSLLRDETADMYILPLLMEHGNTLIERLQAVEYEAIQNLTIRATEHNHPILCSGANLIVRRKRWLDCFNDAHPDLPSGDDMFMLEAFKRKGYKISTLSSSSYFGNSKSTENAENAGNAGNSKSTESAGNAENSKSTENAENARNAKSTESTENAGNSENSKSTEKAESTESAGNYEFSDALNALASVRAVPSLRLFLRQRMRWAGKGPHYTDHDIRRVGAIVIIFNILCLLCPLLFIPKMFIESRFLSHWSWTATLLSLLYPIYIIICCLGGLLHPQRW